MSKSNKKQSVAVTTESIVSNEPSVESVVMSTEPQGETIPFKYEDLIETHKTKSAMIRYLHDKGYSRGTIAKFMGIKYQFVRNVLIVPVKKSA